MIRIFTAGGLVAELLIVSRTVYLILLVLYVYTAAAAGSGSRITLISAVVTLERVLPVVPVNLSPT